MEFRCHDTHSLQKLTCLRDRTTGLSESYRTNVMGYPETIPSIAALAAGQGARLSQEKAPPRTRSTRETQSIVRTRRVRLRTLSPMSKHGRSFQ